MNENEWCNLIYNIIMMENIIHDWEERYYHFLFVIHEPCFNKIFKTNLVLAHSVLNPFHPILSHSFALE
jgi:hypothetical protein